MYVFNVYNEKEKCDNCGKPPVEMIVFIEDGHNEKYCMECFSKKKFPEPEV
jgi:hypothetical protein